MLFNLFASFLLASSPMSDGLLDCQTYEKLMNDLEFPDVSLDTKAELIETIKGGTDPGCFKQ